MIRVCINIKA